MFGKSKSRFEERANPDPRPQMILAGKSFASQKKTRCPTIPKPPTFTSKAGIDDEAFFKQFEFLRPRSSGSNDNMIKDGPKGQTKNDNSGTLGPFCDASGFYLHRSSGSNDRTINDGPMGQANEASKNDNSGMAFETEETTTDAGHDTDMTSSDESDIRVRVPQPSSTNVEFIDAEKWYAGNRQRYEYFYGESLWKVTPSGDLDDVDYLSLVVQKGKVAEKFLKPPHALATVQQDREDAHRGVDSWPEECRNRVAFLEQQTFLAKEVLSQANVDVVGVKEDANARYREWAESLRTGGAKVQNFILHSSRAERFRVGKLRADGHAWGHSEVRKVTKAVHKRMRRSAKE